MEPRCLQATRGICAKPIRNIGQEDEYTHSSASTKLFVSVTMDSEMTVHSSARQNAPKYSDMNVSLKNVLKQSSLIPILGRA